MRRASGRCWRACAEAKKRKRSVVSGLCLRYDAGYRETVKRIHAGAIGDVRVLQATDLRGPNWGKARKPEWTDMQYQMRNWYNFAWLSGDFNVEQHVHNLDVCAWVMKDQYPTLAYGVGGRQARTGPEFGHIYDHFAVVYEYESGARLVSVCRQQDNCKKEVSVKVYGTGGRAELTENTGGLWIKSDKDWTFDGPFNAMYQAEHDALFASIRSGEPIDNGDYMAKSTLLAIMGRMAAYTGGRITWNAALASTEDLSPPRHDWDAKLPEPPVAVPGTTRFK